MNPAVVHHSPHASREESRTLLDSNSLPAVPSAQIPEQIQTLETSRESTARAIQGMRVSFVVNARASNPRAAEIASEIQAGLRSMGAHIDSRPSLAEYTGEDRKDYTQFLSSADIAVIAGGDGTLMGLLPLLQSAKRPVYMLPVGNESLFAAQYGMKADLETVVRFLKHGTNQFQHTGLINGHPFFSMVSIGLDSLTVEAVAKARSQQQSGKASDRMYAVAGAKQLIWNLFELDPVLSIKIDGERIATRERGYLIIGNTASYARNLNLLPSASANAKDLIVGFHPATRREAFVREIRKAFALGRHQEATFLAEALQPRRALREIIIDLHSDRFPIQVDGEILGGKATKKGTTLVLKPSDPISVLVSR